VLSSAAATCTFSTVPPLIVILSTTSLTLISLILIVSSDSIFVLADSTLTTSISDFSSRATRTFSFFTSTVAIFELLM